MTENENLEKKIADDLSAVLKETKSMGCKEVTYFRNIPLQNVETVVRALEEIQAYRTIGTVEGFECAIESSIENYNLMKEYKAKVQEYKAIGTIEEFKALKEKFENAKDDIRKLLSSEYGSSCQFCVHDENEDAMCCNIGGSGSWCCENARWKEH